MSKSHIPPNDKNVRLSRTFFLWNKKTDGPVTLRLLPLAANSLGHIEKDKVIQIPRGVKPPLDTLPKGFIVYLLGGLGKNLGIKIHEKASCCLK